MQAIVLKDINKKYALSNMVLHALKNVSITVPQGERVCVVGHSGSGKSTLFNIVGCMLTPTSGSYILNGENVNLLSDKEIAKIRSENIGYVFQNCNLIHRLTVEQNIRLPMLFDQTRPKEAQELAYNVMEQTGVLLLKDKKANELSGGQRQLVALARAMVKKPSIILADEPTGNLDEENENRVLSILHKANQNGVTVMVITHSQAIAHTFGRVIRLENGKIDEQ